MASKVFKPNSILKKYELRKGKQLRKADGLAVRSNIFVCYDLNKKKYIAKIFMSKDENAKKRFIREVLVIRKLRTSVKRYKSWLPRIKKFSLNGQHPYYIYEYIDADQLGTFVNDFGVKWGRFCDKNFQDFMCFFDLIAQKDDEFEKIDISNWGSRTAMKEIQFYLENVPDLLPGYLYDQIRSFLDRKRSIAFKNRELSHRDLYPENILIKKNQTSTFSFLDWEYFGYVPIGFNAAFLYLLFWREEYWQAKVISHFHNKYVSQKDDKALRNFYTSFRFCLVVLGIRFLYQLETYGDKSSSSFNSAKSTFLNSIESALAGDVAKPRNIKFLISKNDIQRVCSDYGLGKVGNYCIFYASKGNTVIKVEADTGMFILRFYSISRSNALINKELSIFKHLDKLGVKTYKVVRSFSGALYSSYKLYGRNRRVAVLTYIKGKKIKRKWANKNAAIGVGKELRKIHDAGVIHGDFSKENVLFIKSKVSGVIDFEWGRFTKSKKAHQSDLAKAIALWLIDIREKGMPNTEFVIYLLEGYTGKPVKSRLLRRIVELSVGKVQEERAVFLTPIDKSDRENPELGRRFDKAIKTLKGLVSQ